MEAVLYLGVAIATTLADVLLARGRRPMIPNPSLADIQARHYAEEACRKAERAAHEATMLVERLQREIEVERERARARQEEADRAAARAAEEMRRMMIQMETAERAARLAQELAEAAAKAAKEEVDRLLQGVREEKERAMRMQREAEKAALSAREDAERVKRAAADERIKAEAGKALAEEASRTAKEERRKAFEAKEEAERHLKEGIQPIVTPSPEELAQYMEDYFHSAIAGVSGSGKSSLVNAFRGLQSKDAGAADVGITETTLQTTFGVCLWRDQVTSESRVCGAVVSCKDVSEHFKYHGIKNIDATTPVVCRWEGCYEGVLRKNFMRHVRERHLGQIRYKGHSS